MISVYQECPSILSIKNAPAFVHKQKQRLAMTPVTFIRLVQVTECWSPRTQLVSCFFSFSALGFA